MEKDNEFRKLMDMKSSIEYIFFKKFEREYDFPRGLNRTHALAMILIHFHPQAAMSEVSQMLNLERGSFTSIADKLVRLGYIISERGTKDRRVYHLSLTEKGDVFTQEFMKKHQEYYKHVIDSLDKDDRRDFFDAISIVTRVMKTIQSSEEFDDK